MGVLKLLEGKTKVLQKEIFDLKFTYKHSTKVV